MDFYCPQYKLGIEVDGGQHYEEKNKQRDEFRTELLSNLEIQILRFNNLEILNNIEGVYETIQKTIEKRRPPSPRSSPF